jgi:hypothetical protein
MLGLDRPLAWSQKGDDLLVQLPEFGPDEGPSRHAWAFKLTKVE